MPTMIWLPEVLEPAANFVPFFSRPDNRIRDMRNVWCLDYRNQGDSDHHDSYDMDEIAADIVRFMDKEQITTATIGGHGFGAKVAAATAINHMDRFTGVCMLEGGPVDHTYHEAYHELRDYVQFAASIPLAHLEPGQAMKKIDDGIACRKWAGIFKQNLNTEGSTLAWKSNMHDLAKNVSKTRSDIAIWDESYGLWPGQALALFAANSRWIHLSTNTLPFYNVFPRLQETFGDKISTVASDLEGPMTHWIHEEPKDQVFFLANRMARWLRWHDGAHVLLADKSEAGWKYIAERGTDAAGPGGEYTPEHVHHNYLYSNIYEKDRKERGVEGAGHGTFQKPGVWSARQ